MELLKGIMKGTFSGYRCSSVGSHEIFLKEKVRIHASFNN